MPRKSKKNQPKTPKVVQPRDLFQTPSYATDLIVPFLQSWWTIWEPCANEGKISQRLQWHNFDVHSTDILNGPQYDVLEYIPEFSWDCVVTNPPFSIKDKVTRRLIDLNRPFALLVPGDWSMWLWESVAEYQCELVVPSRRINYITPIGKQGKDSQAMFHSVWLTRKLGLSNNLVPVTLSLDQIKNNI